MQKDKFRFRSIVAILEGLDLIHHAFNFPVFRFIRNSGVGASSVTAPIYISEIFPASKRNRSITLFQSNIVSGMLISYFSNYLERHLRANGNQLYNRNKL